jgi:hypothetical protein
VLHIVLQSERHGDCGIATTATYLGHTYEEVLTEVARMTKGKILDRGLNSAQIVRVAKRLGHALHQRAWEHVDQDEATGILYVKARIYDEQYSDHLVVYRRGDVLDCRDGTLWDADVYFRHFAADPVTLFLER